MHIDVPKIKTRLAELEMTQSSLAQALGVSRQRISQCFIRGSCCAETFTKICDALGVKPTEIIGVEPKQKSKSVHIDRVKLNVIIARKDLKLYELAARAGVSNVTLSVIRKKESCSMETANKIAAALGVSASEFCGDGGDIT